MADRVRKQAIEARLERFVDAHGDPRGAVMAEFYRRFPDAQASFAHHSPHNPARLEEEMVGNTIYYLLCWFENPVEARIYFDSSVPHHRVALAVPPDWFRGLIETVIDVIETGAPAVDPAEQGAWSDMRAGLVGLVERNRFE